MGSPLARGTQARGRPASEGRYPSTEAAWVDPPPPDEGYGEDLNGEDCSPGRLTLPADVAKCDGPQAPSTPGT